MVRHLTTTMALLLLPVLGSPAHSQDTTPRPAVELTCSDVAALEPAHSAALIYYIAGYVDGAAAATTPPDEARPLPNIPGGLTLSASAVLDACATDTSARVADVIAGLGGSMNPTPATRTPEDASPG